MQSDVVKHYPVLLNELISIITPQYGGTFIDCTFGQGGYSEKILSFKNTEVIALDRDIETKKKADKISKEFQDRFIFKNKKFSQLDDLKEFGVDTDEPDLFNSNSHSSNSDELLESSEDNIEDEDDLEIPAFLRRQKN